MTMTDFEPVPMELAFAKPTRLYTANEIGRLFSTTRYWVIEHMLRDGSPPPDFIIVRGSEQPLWTAASVDHWRAYFASQESIPRHRTAAPGVRRPLAKSPRYSDDNAVNQVGPVSVTWKLSWRATRDGGTMYWLSSPVGWWVSNDDGRTWDNADVMVRPQGYRYQFVNGSVRPPPHVAAVLRSADELRKRLLR